MQLQRIAAEGGVEARWQRHREMLDTVEGWVDGRGGTLGLSYLPARDRRSWTVSCLNIPEGLNGRDIRNALADRGWTIATGYGDLKKSTIRIGHMGDHTVAELTELLAELEEVLA